MIRIQQLPRGQIVINIPQAIAVALDLKKGDEIVFKIDGSRLYLERAK